MKKVKRLILVFFICSLPINYFSLTGDAKLTADPPSIAILFSIGGLGDNGFNDVAYQGLVDANTTYLDQFTYTYVEPQSIDEMESNVTSHAEAGYDLIICVGFLYGNIVNTNAQLYPDQRFMIIDTVVNQQNVSSITFKEQEGSFLAGAMAAMTTQTGKIGFLGGMNIWLINKFLAGYQQGAHYINSSIDIAPRYSPNLDNPWGDVDSGKIIGEKLLSEGNDIIYTAAGGTGLGVIQAVDETTGAYAIGVDSDQDYLAQGKVLTSMLKKVNTAVNNSIEDIVLDTWSAGHTELGIAEDGVDISPMTYTDSIRDGNYNFNSKTKTRWEWIQEFKQNITDGTITVSEDPESLITLPKIGLILAPGDKNDNGYNNNTLKGLQDAFLDYAGNFTYRYKESTFVDELANHQDNMASEGYDVIICIGFYQIYGLYAVALNYQSQKFVLIDDESIMFVGLPNVASFTFKVHEGSFLAGAMAAMTTQTGKIGFLGGSNTPVINRFLAGYQLGAHFINSSIEISPTYSPNLDNPWNDTESAKIIGNKLYSEGNDIIYTAAGISSQGVFEAANETSDVFAIGTDFDQDYMVPGKILTSMMKRYDVAVYNSIEDIILDTWSSGYYELGIAENGTDFSPMTYTDSIKNGAYTFNSITKTRWEWIQELKQNISDGTIIVNDVPEKAIVIPRIGITLSPEDTQDIYLSAGKKGVHDVFLDYAGNFTYRLVEPTSSDDLTNTLGTMASAGYDLIICMGFLYNQPLQDVAPLVPSQQFTIVDSWVNLPNVASLIFKEHEGSFLAGAMAAMTTQTGKIGFLGATDIYLINKFLAGYQQGAQYFNSSIEITWTYSPDQINPWDDFEGGKDNGTTFIDQDHDIIFAAAGRTGLGVLDAINETSGVYYIGVDTDQDHLAPGIVLTSMMKRFDIAVYNSIESVILSTWSNGQQELGLYENGTHLSQMTYTDSIKNGNFNFDGLTMTRGEWIENITQKILDGTIVVSDTPDWSTLSPLTIPPLITTTIEPTTTETPTTTTTTTEIPTTTTTTTETTISESDAITTTEDSVDTTSSETLVLGTNWPGLYVTIFGIIPLLILIKRMKKS